MTYRPGYLVGGRAAPGCGLAGETTPLNGECAVVTDAPSNMETGHIAGGGSTNEALLPPDWKPSPGSPLVSVFRRLSVAAGVAVMAVAATVLLGGWVLGNPGLQSLTPGLPKMMANTSLGLLLSGASLLLWNVAPGGRWSVRVARWLGVVAASLGTATLAEYSTGVDLHIDQLLFRDFSAGATYPGRPSPQTSVALAFTGVSLLLLGGTRLWTVWTAQILGLAVGFIALVATIGYVYQSLPFYAVTTYTGMALPTVFGFLAVSSGIICARPDRGLAALPASPMAGGMLVRRLLPAIIIIPVVLGGLRAWGERAGLFTNEFGLALEATVYIVAVALPLWVFAGTLQRTEAERQAANRALEDYSVRIQAAEQKYRGLYDSIKDGIVYTDITGKFLNCNQAYSDMLGYSEEELRGLTYKEITPAKWEAMENEIVGDHITRRGYSDEYEKEYIRKDGAVFPISLRAWLVRDKDGQAVGMWGIVRDITLRKHAEEAIVTLNEELKQRAVELEASNKELEAFSYSVSHDLRSPLRSMAGFSQALLEDYGARLDEQGRGYLARIQASSDLMGRLIDDLLELSRVTRAGMRPEPIDLSALALAALAEIQKAQPQRRVEYAVAPGLMVQGDSRLIHLLMENLLENAWKFTAKAASPRIEVGVADRDGTRAYFVRDNGAGFDMAYAGKLFLPFQRLHKATEFPGTGIGLATVQRIVQRHGGRVWGEGETGRGATFYFTLSHSIKQG
ncbi:MAG: PAS domain S-box protein [Chloroflexi bacterium]|nr:PAS domain S-box protein [Chloroflexota bacterium]